MRSRLRALIMTATATLGIATAMFAAPSPANAAGEVYGCPSGAVCIYDTTDIMTAEHITQKFWSYGPHNLVRQFDRHNVLNNQYGGPGATAVLCYGSNGRDCTGYTVNPWPTCNCYSNMNLTPFNSIYLNRP